MKLVFHFTNSLLQKMAKLVIHQNSFHKDDKLSDNKWFWNICWTSSVIAVYFVLSVGLTFYQKWCMKHFSFPLIMVSTHFIIKWTSCVIMRCIMQSLVTRTDTYITFKNQVSKIVPVGVCSALDIAFSNWGLVFIKITLYTMTKSSTIVFILFFALLFKLEKKSCFLVLIVGMISGGLFMFTYEATNFNVFGFLLVLFASFASGLRWTLAQSIMQRSELGLKNPVDMIYYVQPWMILAVLPFAVIQEGGKIAEKWDALSSFDLMAVVCGAFIALGMELSEFLVVLNTSSLTLSVAGIFKEICILVLAVEWEDTSMTKLNFIGLLLCLGGIVLHVIHKARSTVVNNKPYIDEASARFLPEGSSSSDDETGHEDSSTEVLFSVLNSRDR